MPLINTSVAPFKATAFHNGKFVDITEQTLKGRWSVFVFYPADFTFVCPTELEDLADRHDQFKALGVDVYGISTDTHFAHKAWHDTSDAIRKVRYPLIGDPTGRISRSFDVLVEDTGLALRGTFVIDPEAASRPPRCTTTASAAMRASCCARWLRPSTWPAIPDRSAPPSGKRARRR